MEHQATEHDLQLALDGACSAVSEVPAKTDQLELAIKIHPRLCELNADKSPFGRTNSSEENEHDR